MNPYYSMGYSPPPIYPWSTYSPPVDSSIYESNEGVVFHEEPHYRTQLSFSELDYPVYASAQVNQNVHEMDSLGMNASQMFPSVYERLGESESSYQSSSDPPSPIGSAVQSPAIHEKILTIPGGPCLWKMGGRVCMKWCQNPEEMSAHLNEVHIPRENNVVCYWTNCGQEGKPFKKRYAIVNHVRVHTGETPFQCDVCRKGFARAANLKIHERIHTGDKPFLCPVDGCLKRCSNSSDRIRHIRSHFEGSPYECKKCDKKYTDPSSLRTHVRKHHEKGSSGTSGSEESLTDTSRLRQSPESEYQNLVINPSYSQVEHSGFYDHRYQIDQYPYNSYEYHPM